MTLQFTSTLDTSYRDALEELLFFHPHQGRFSSGIIGTVERHGSPRIVAEQGTLRVQLGKRAEAQTVYALVKAGATSELAGIIIFTRSQNELILLHIAVKEKYTARGSQADADVTFWLIEELRRIAHRIHGVHGVRLAYNRGRKLLTTMRPTLANGC